MIKYDEKTHGVVDDTKNFLDPDISAFVGKFVFKYKTDDGKDAFDIKNYDMDGYRDDYEYFFKDYILMQSTLYSHGEIISRNNYSEDGRFLRKEDFISEYVVLYKYNDCKELIFTEYRIVGDQVLIHRESYE